MDIKGSVLVELSGHLDTTPNYLLGVEDKEEDEFVLKAEQLLSKIKDEKTKKILLAQITAVLSMSGMVC